MNTVHQSLGLTACVALFAAFGCGGRPHDASPSNTPPSKATAPNSTSSPNPNASPNAQGLATSDRNAPGGASNAPTTNAPSSAATNPAANTNAAATDAANPNPAANPITPNANAAAANPNAPAANAPDIPAALIADRSEAGVTRGRELYGRICSVCHGARGEGYKADQAPALSNQSYLATVSDEFLRIAIVDGRAGTVMSPWSVEHGGPLTAADVSAVIGFLRSWQKEPSIELDESPLRGAALMGAAVFSRECAKCHGPKGPYLHLMNPQLLEPATAGFLRHAIRNGRPPTKMPAYKDSLGDQGVEDVVAYLVALARSPVMQKAGVVELPQPWPRNAIPLNPRGREPRNFTAIPQYTAVDIVARELKAGARMTLLDARAPADYATQHIKGAVNVPFYDPAPFFDKLPKNSWLVCYCGCPHAESGALAQKLVAAGFKRVTVLNEGLGDWMMKGHPTSTGPNP